MPVKRQARKCTAKRSNGTPCSNYAMNGGLVCHAHGGRARQVKVKNAESAVADKVRAQLARVDVEPISDPLSEMSKMAGEAVAWKDAIRDRVNDLTSIRYSTENGEQLRAEIALFERAMDRCERFLTAMGRLNIDERLARISERQAEAVIQAVTGGLMDAGIPQAMQIEASQHIVRRLHAVANS